MRNGIVSRSKTGVLMALAGSALLATLFAGSASAQPAERGLRAGAGQQFSAGHRGPGRRGGARHTGRFAERRAEHLAAALELTDEQEQAWEQLRSDHQASIQPLHEALRGHRLAVADLLEQPDPDPAAVGSEVISGRDLEQQVSTLSADLEQDFRDLLTSEQLERYEDIRSRSRRGGGPRRGFATR